MNHQVFVKRQALYDMAVSPDWNHDEMRIFFYAVGSINAQNWMEEEAKDLAKELGIGIKRVHSALGKLGERGVLQPCDKGYRLNPGFAFKPAQS